METFFHMGGYAAFIWPAYGVAAIVLAGLLITSLRTLRARQAAFIDLRENLEARQPSLAIGTPANDSLDEGPGEGPGERPDGEPDSPADRT